MAFGHIACIPIAATEQDDIGGVDNEKVERTISIEIKQRLNQIHFNCIGFEKNES